jgi:hypothetical protein
LRVALDRNSDEIDAAKAQMPEWARGGPKYVSIEFPILNSTSLNGGDVGWPEIADLDQQKPIDGIGRILARPNVEDLYERFQVDVRANREEARLKLTRALIAHDERLKQQKAEQERTGYSRLTDRRESAWKTVRNIEDAIQNHVDTSVLALAAILALGIREDREEDEVLLAYRASLRAIRPQLVGAIAADADRVLAQDGKARS